MIMRPSLANMNISIKVYATPVLLMASLIILLGVFLLGMSRQSTALSDLRAASFERARFAAEVERLAIGAQSNTYRLIGWRAAKVAPEKSARLHDTIRADLLALKSIIKKHSTSGIAGEEAELTQAMADLTKYFISSLGETAAMAESDHEAALALMTDSETITDSLTNSVTDFQRFTASKAQEVYDDAISIALTSRAVFVAIFVLFMALGGAVMVVVARAITGPVNHLTDAMVGYAAGDLSAETPLLDRRDEIGAMARAVAVFVDGLKHTAELEKKQRHLREAMAEKAREREIHIAAFDASMDEVLASVMQTVASVRDVSDQLEGNVQQATSRASTVAARAGEASSDVNTVVSAAEQLGLSVSEISQQVSMTAAIAGEAVHGAQTANNSVGSLEDASRRIGEIVTLINHIAHQTNLLALNATIEAARAGDAGKGFAVVAGEVKNLANQTAKATEGIAGQVSGIQSVSREAANIIRHVGETITRVNDIVVGIASAVEEQSAATQEIVRSIQQIAIGNSDITSNIADVSLATEATGQITTMMLSAAGELSAQTEGLRKEIAGFLSKVRDETTAEIRI